MKRLIFLLFLGSSILPLSAQQVVDVYLLGGQSNMTGQGLVFNLPAGFLIDKEVMMYYSRFTNQGEGSMQWNPLCPAAERKARFGVELTLGGGLHKAYPDRKIALIKHALSGSNLYTQWNPGNRPGEKRGAEYQKFITTVHEGIKALREQGYTPVIRGMVWQQGEADAREVAGDANNRAYGRNLKNFIEQVRKELTCADLLFVYGTVMPLAAERFVGRDLVKQAQYQVSEAAHSELSVKNAILVEADDLQMLRSDYLSPNPKDDVHLGSFGLLTLGQRFAAAIVSSLKATEASAK